MRFESIETRQLLSADFCWSIGGIPNSAYENDANLPAIVAPLHVPTETPAALKSALPSETTGIDTAVPGVDPTPNPPQSPTVIDVPLDTKASQLKEVFVNVASSESIDASRQIKELKPFWELPTEAGGLPDAEDDQFSSFVQDPLTNGTGDDVGFWPGMEPGRGNPLDSLKPDTGNPEEKKEDVSDPFAKVGWASNEYDTVSVSSDGRRYNHVHKDENYQSSEQAVSTDHSHVYTQQQWDETSSGQSQIIMTRDVIIIHEHGVQDTPKGPYEYSETTEIHRHGDTFTFTHTYSGRRIRPNDTQPNPEGETGGYGYLGSDPWEEYFFNYTRPWLTQSKGGRGLVVLPDESAPGGATAAHRIGPEAVTNPGDSLWMPNSKSGGKSQPLDPRDPFPGGPTPHD